MTLILMRQHRTRKSKSVMTREAVQASHCIVRTLGDSGLCIEFHGKLADIPNMKNSKPLWGGLPIEAEAKLLAMTALFFQATAGQTFDFGTTPLSVCVLCAERSRNFDPIGVAETVQDWLEPQAKIIGRKQKRQRGWGIGVTADDRYITSYAVRSEQVGPAAEYTRILIRPWSAVMAHAVGLVAGHYL